MDDKVLLWHQDVPTIEQSLPSCKFFRALSSLGIAGVASRLSTEAGYGLRKLSAVRARCQLAQALLHTDGEDPDIKSAAVEPNQDEASGPTTGPLWNPLLSTWFNC